jgi:hypothetical protein
MSQVSLDEPRPQAVNEAARRWIHESPRGVRAAAGLTAEQILEAARRHTAIAFDLGVIDPDAPRETILLNRLAEVRREHGFDFDFRVAASQALSKAGAERMRAAGVKRLSLIDQDAPSRANTGAAARWLRQLQAMKWAHAADIEVGWSIGFDTPAELAAWLALDPLTLVHLPPPQGATCAFAQAAGQAEALQRRLAEWAGRHNVRSLTYARGPGFCRLFDRRASDADWRFVILSGVQGDIYRFCDASRGFDEIAAQFTQAPPSALRGFLDVLLGQGTLCGDGQGHFQSLAVRRAINERWASGDY